MPIWFTKLKMVITMPSQLEALTPTERTGELFHTLSASWLKWLDELLDYNDKHVTASTAGGHIMEPTTRAFVRGMEFSRFGLRHLQERISDAARSDLANETQAPWTALETALCAYDPAADETLVEMGGDEATRIVRAARDRLITAVRHARPIEDAPVGL